jgi:uncharacterized protein (TIGR02246 family)
VATGCGAFGSEFMNKVFCAFCLGAVLAVTTAQESSIQQQIERATAKWADTWNRKDAAGLANLYTRDAVLLPANSPQVTGRTSIREYWEKSLAQASNDSLDFRSVEVQPCGDMVVQISTFADKRDGQVYNSGKGLTLWKREDGAWKMHRDTWNDDKPWVDPALARKMPLAEELMPFARDIGDWTVTYTDAEGKEAKGRFVMEADPSGRSVTGYWSGVSVWGEGVGRNIWYFDPHTDRLMGFSIGPDGALGWGTGPRKGDKQAEVTSISFQGFTSTGEIMSGWDHLKRIDNDTIEYTTTDFVLAGQKMPDAPKMLLKRIKK